jgi:hypothetical protein
VGEFELRYAPDVGMIFVVEFNPKIVLEHISVPWREITAEPEKQDLLP